MRILIFHGYLLRGTGSNIYNVELSRWLVRLGHEVHLFCQDAQAAELDFVDAVGRWRDGQLHTEVYRAPVRCTVYLPDIGGLLPVYVADQYAGFEAKPFPELTDAEIERYIAANGAAIRDVVAAVRPDAALANHLVMGPVILARALAGQVPYAVKIHGSALEYTVRPQAGRFGGYAREGLQGATGVLVGSRHTAESLWEVVDMPGLPARTRLLPPGVDTRRFHPRPVDEATARLAALAARLEAAPLAWGGDPGAGQALLAADPARDRIVSYVGKLIVSKGVDLLIAAWPLVVHQVPAARLIVAGFGGYRPGLMELTYALARGDLAAARAVADKGRELEGGPPGELHFLAAFLDSLDGAERGRYLSALGGGHAPGALHRADRARRRVRADVRVRGGGHPEHVPGGVRHGAGRGGLLRVGAAGRPALRARRGHRRAVARDRRRPAPAAVLRAGPGRGAGHRQQAGRLAGAGRDEARDVAAGPARADHSGPGRIRLGPGGYRGSRGGAR